MISPAVLDRVRVGTCAVGCLTVPVEQLIANPGSPGFKIIGTGFVIADGLAMTNRHVIHKLTLFAEQERLGEDRFFLQFNYPRAGGIQQAWCRFQKYGAVLNDVVDVGLVGYKARPEVEFRQVKPLEFQDKLDLKLGEEIAAFGFAFGSDHLERQANGKTQLYRFGPILQQGFVSGFAPYFESDRVDRLLLDLRTSGGMSGSPIFKSADGTVVGIHDAGRDATTAFAIPLTRSIVDTLKTAHADAAIGTPFQVAITSVERLRIPTEQPR